MVPFIRKGTNPNQKSLLSTHQDRRSKVPTQKPVIIIQRCSQHLMVAQELSIQHLMKLKHMINGISQHQQKQTMRIQTSSELHWHLIRH
jgi:hypothetical protein